MVRSAGVHRSAQSLPVASKTAAATSAVVINAVFMIRIQNDPVKFAKFKAFLP